MTASSSVTYYSKMIADVWLLFLFSNCTNSEQKSGNWEFYGGSKNRIQHSLLTQIDTSNIQQLQPAWEYYTKDMTSGSQIKANSIVIRAALYGVSP